MLTEHEVVTEVLRREGWPAVTDRPSDLGGLTKGGVTLSSFNEWRRQRGEAQVSRAEFPDAVDEPTARAFFTDRYVGPWRFVTDESCRTLLSDWAVTSWHDDPARALQQELQARGLYAGPVDGVAGRNTRAGWAAFAAGAGDMVAMRRGLCARRDEFYLSLALDRDESVEEFLRAHPRTQLRNLRGWLRRSREWWQ